MYNNADDVYKDVLGVLIAIYTYDFDVRSMLAEADVMMRIERTMLRKNESYKPVFEDISNRIDEAFVKYNGGKESLREVADILDELMKIAIKESLLHLSTDYEYIPKEDK